MLAFTASKKHSAYPYGKQQGFVILTSVVLLCVGGILFTTNMVSSQLIDNQIVGNYYRNNEAFVNAESGVHFALSQLPPPATLDPKNLPFSYSSADNHYKTQVTMAASSSDRLQITSEGTSADGTAKKVMTLEVEPYFDFPIPTAAFSSNGKVNLTGNNDDNDNNNALIINGCDGAECQASGSVAENSLLTNPELEYPSDVGCTESQGQENLIDENTLVGNITVDTVSKGESGIYEWGESLFPKGAEIGGISIDSELSASSLFEKTFGTEMSQESLNLLRNNALIIDMKEGDDCLDKLQEVSNTDVIIFISGTCTLNSYISTTIGTSEEPKLVIAEDGVFAGQVNIFGMLYFIPDIIAEGEESDLAIDMGGVSVEGALLSEYNCSYLNNNGASLFVNFNKSALNNLYAALGVEAIASGYRLSVGTWRDFE